MIIADMVRLRTEIQDALTRITAIVGFDVDLYRVRNNVLVCVGKLGPLDIKVPYSQSAQSNYGPFYILPAGMVNVSADNIKDQWITTFSLTWLPGCCAYVVSHGCMVNLWYQKKGINTICFRIRECISMLNGYTGMLITDIERNEATWKLANHRKFGKIHTLKNIRTNNTVVLAAKELDYIE